MNMLYIYYASSFILTFLAGYVLGRILEHDSQVQELMDSLRSEP